MVFKELKTTPLLPAKCSSSSLVQGDRLILVGGAVWYPTEPDIIIVDLTDLKASFIQLQVCFIIYTSIICMYVCIYK